ncbi:SGNH/GDSL hydrolase family protein [Fulvivirgaceae bacterium LMO-SS25]
MKKLALSLIAFLVLIFTNPLHAQVYSYLALGDSYTIGEGVTEADRYPNQLAAMLNMDSLNLASPMIIARTGWTTDELTKAIEERTDLAESYDLVTLLIGVNNQYRGRSVEEYEEQLAYLLETAIKFAGGDNSRVFVISIPDWSVTPFADGRNTDKAKVAKEIDQFNEVKKMLCEEYGVDYTEITEAYRANGNEMVVADKLHPSKEIYQEWAAALAEKVKSRLAK